MRSTFLSYNKNDMANFIQVTPDNKLIAGIKYAIKSRSSGKYLDGRNPEHDNPLITARPPQGDAYLNWTFVPVNDGFFAIRSASSGKYLDGRNPEHNDPLITTRDPTNDHYLQWNFVPLQFLSGIKYAIQSRSSNKYLDGRNPEHENPLITARDPTNDAYLQWTIKN